MTASGPFPFGEGWDDPDAPGGAGPVDEGTPSEHAAGPCGGWIPPEERLWRHPSEVWAGSAGSAETAGAGTGYPTPTLGAEGARHDPQAAPRSRLSWATAIVGAGAAAALVAGGLLLADTGSGHAANSGPGAAQTSQASRATTAVTALVTGPGARLPAPARQVERSLVSLEIGTTHGTSTSTAVAVGEGGLIATTADALAGSASVTAFTATGRRERAQLVAMDRGSDVALLRVPEDLPVAHFLDHLDAPIGHQAVVVGMLPANGGASGKAKVVWSVGTINSPAATVTAGDAYGLAAIAATVPFLPEQAGNVLLDADGTVLGIFDKSGTPQGTANGMFLPADLVLGVSDALAGQGQVRHGWLGIEGTSSSTALGEPPGALVTGVDPSGPAVRYLEPGDIIESIDGDAVRSMAQLREQLYVLAPDIPVTLGVLRDGSLMAVEVDLGSSF